MAAGYSGNRALHLRGIVFYVSKTLAPSSEDCLVRFPTRMIRSRRVA